MSPYLSSLVAFLAVVCGLALLLRSGLAHRLAIDNPNQRSLHSQPTPRIGGLVLVPGMLAGWLLQPGVSPLLMLLVAALATLSYLDDRAGLPTLLRFLAHLGAAAVFVANMPAAESWLVGSVLVLAIAWFANLYNFMDGSDGLAGGMAVIGFAALGIAAAQAGQSLLAAQCLAVAAAATGFLLFNFHPAKVFLGDAGSVTLGFLAGALGCSGWQAGIWPLWFSPLVFSPFVVDATVTLLRRMLRGERFWEAHREHYFQRLVRMGWGHRRTALAWYAAMLAAALAALAMRELTSGGLLLAGGLCVLGYAWAMTTIDRSWQRFLTAGKNG